MIGYRLQVINVFSVMIYVYIHREYCIEKLAWCWGLMVYSHFRIGTSFHFIHHKYNALWIIIIPQLLLRIFHSPFPMLWIHRHMDCCKKHYFNHHPTFKPFTCLRSCASHPCWTRIVPPRHVAQVCWLRVVSPLFTFLVFRSWNKLSQLGRERKCIS